MHAYFTVALAGGHECTLKVPSFLLFAYATCALRETPLLRGNS